MNTATRIADAYAEAVMDVAIGNGVDLQVMEDLKLVHDCLGQGSSAMEWLCLPSISRYAKLQILENTFKGRFHAFTLRLLLLMVRRGRTRVLPELYDALIRYRNRKEGIMPVEVKTAHRIGDEQKRLFEEKIRRTFGASSSISYTTHPDLLGGFQVISPEKKIDHSLKTGLSRIKKQLLHQ